MYELHGFRFDYTHVTFFCFLNYENFIFLRNIFIKSGFLRKSFQPIKLIFLALAVFGQKACLGLNFSDFFCGFESFCKKMNNCGIEVVDCRAQSVYLLGCGVFICAVLGSVGYRRDFVCCFRRIFCIFVLGL